MITYARVEGEGIMESEKDLTQRREDAKAQRKELN
jgi:hypothetical protein